MRPNSYRLLVGEGDVEGVGDGLGLLPTIWLMIRNPSPLKRKAQTEDDVVRPRPIKRRRV
jgi:hypothetical protein